MKIVRIIGNDKTARMYEQEKRLFEKKNNLNHKHKVLSKEFGGLYDILTRECEFKLPQLNGKNRTESIKTIDSLIGCLEIISLENAMKKFSRSSCQIYPGTYACHPHLSDVLVPLKDIYMTLSLEKDCELVYLLGMMKAKEVRIERKETQSQTSGLGVRIPNISTGLEGFVGVKVDRDKSSESSLLVKFECTIGRIPHDLLEKSIWFKSDGRLGLFFKSRIEGQIMEYKEEFSNSYKEDFGLRFSILETCFGLGLRAGFESICQMESTFSVEFHPYQKPKELQENLGELSSNVTGKFGELLKGFINPDKSNKKIDSLMEDGES